jgi:hypothetical protein
MTPTLRNKVSFSLVYPSRSQKILWLSSPNRGAIFFTSHCQFENRYGGDGIFRIPGPSSDTSTKVCLDLKWESSITSSVVLTGEMAI